MKTVTLLLWFSSVIMGAEYSVIVSKKVPFSILTAQQVREVFLQKRHTIGDQKMIPVNLIGQDEVRSRFESAVLGMDRNRLSTYWIKQHFQGVIPPLTQPSFESIKVFVQNVDGAIGYVPSAMVDNTVKAVYEF